MAEPAGDIAETEQEAQQRHRHRQLARGAEAEPGAVGHQDVAHAQRLGPGGMKRDACRLDLGGEARDARGEVVEVDRLEALVPLPGQRQNAWEPGQPAHQ